MVIMGFDFKSLKDKIVNSYSYLPLSEKKNVGIIFGDPVASIFERFLERERVLLSRISGDPTVGGLRAEKEKRSTRSRQRVESGFVSF